jgi:hypothetical protein
MRFCILFCTFSVFIFCSLVSILWCIFSHTRQIIIMDTSEEMRELAEMRRRVEEIEAEAKKLRQLGEQMQLKVAKGACTCLCFV